MGINSLLPQGMQGAGLAGIDRLASNAMFPQSQMDKTQYSVSNQMPTSAEVVNAGYEPKTNSYSGLPMANFAKGGDVEDKDAKASYSVIPQGTQEYDPRFMPLQMDNRPLSGPQAALLRLQIEKQIAEEGRLRAAAMGSVMAVPGERGLRGMPGQFEVGYNTPAGIGNLDISAMRAMRGTPDGKVPYGVNARYSIPFAKGGIARFNDGGSAASEGKIFDESTGQWVNPSHEAQEPIYGSNDWTPDSNKLTLLKQKNDWSLEDIAAGKAVDNPVEQVGYDLNKDDIKGFTPTYGEDPTTPNGGTYTLNDGSTLTVDNRGVVQNATPGRQDYTLNDQGYYQPTGENLTWRGDQNMLYKKIGGVEVQVPNIYHKGGYQDEKGGLRVDANGVPLALAPNYMDSGRGKSTMDDVGKYGVLAALAAMGAAGAYGAMGAGAAEGAGALTTGEMLGSTGFTAAEGGAGFGLPAAGEVAGTVGTAAEAMGPTYAELGYTGAEGAGGFGPTYGELGYEGAGAQSTADAIAQADAAANTAQGMEKLKDAYNVYKNVNRAKSVLNMLNGGQQTSGLGTVPSTTGYNAFNPTIPRAGLPIASGYEKTPWANMMPQISLSKLSEFAPERDMASGGIAHLGGYSDGGRLLKGPGDGMSDNIPASIADKQPARLADGEFVVPADVVSHLGNGSTDAGAKQLYAMMDKVRSARTGNKKQGKQINPSKFLPKG